MKVIGVLDLLANRAVHARAGDRAHYRPVEAVAGSPIDAGDALALAFTYRDRLRLRELYVADLDAILGQAPQQALVRRLSALGVPLWLDAGITSIDQARSAIDLGVAHLIVGLETLPSFEVFRDVCAALDRHRVAFSLDLRHGEPIRSPDGERLPEAIAARAAAAGAAAVIVLDLGRVGTGNGPDCAAITRIRHAVPDTILIAGGGIRGLDDLIRLAGSGCDGALVATALHDGRLGAAQVAAAAELGCQSRNNR